jgi:hypothetical protein
MKKTTVSSLFGHVVTIMVYSKTTFKDVLMVDVTTCDANSVKFVI